MKGGWLQTATQVAALLAGLAALVYAAGAVVLALRLALQDLPWGNVISQLPREFLLSVGTGQVLFPGLVFGAMYGLYRLLRKKRPALRPGEPPTHLPVRPPRWRDGGKERRAAVCRYLVVSVLMLLPLAGVLIVRGSWPQWSTIAVVGLVLSLAAVAVAVTEARAGILRRTKGMRDWSSVQAAAVMAAFYAVAVIPAAIVAAGAVPFSEAKVCATDRHEVEGVLVGETSDRVYLGERGDSPLRLVVLPLSQVEEMFVGADADLTDCQFGSLPPDPIR